MIKSWDRWFRQPLLSDRPPSANRWARAGLFLVWLAVTAWLASKHVPWRDEARAFSLMLMGDSWIDMFRVAHGEGHPYLWYIILKAGHSLFGVREVLPAAGFVIGVAAAATLAFRSPFRLPVIAGLLFSLHLGFEYVVMSRNYGIAALIMLVIAWQWPRIRDSLWLGVLLLLLANTNVPSVFLAGAIFLYRMLELWSEQRDLRAPEWRRWIGNAVLVGLGALLCFIAVYPPANDAAASTNAVPLTPMNLLGALFTSVRSFVDLGFGIRSMMNQIVLVGSLLLFVRRPQALAAAVAGLVCLKLFFFFVYPGHYRHSALFFFLLIALAWIEADKVHPRERSKDQPPTALFLGAWFFVVLIVMQSVLYWRYPLKSTLKGRPHGHSADLAKILARPEFAGSLLMIDPDTMGESVVYQTGRPFWLIRQDRLGTVTPLASTGNKRLTLDRLLEQADSLYRRTGRPVVIALRLPLDRFETGTYDMMYHDFTVLTPASVARFKAATRPVASLRRAREDEEYDVYAYPREPVQPAPATMTAPR
ncbi:hypothetical protein [Sphingomonas sp. LHG3406-1]|uniref:hypothetical protein n=1 Tax=Sphingomonas sp. LHG3406-1 TaxID=2804617 RepID=UPI00260B685E|nr:hypothetical protein [Sphingomonas sp. LHG3406-1]